MSLRQEILKEIKSMLKEEFGFSDLFSRSPKPNAYGYGTKYSICEQALMEYYNEQDLNEAKEKAIYDYKMIGGQNHEQAKESLRKDLSIPGYLMSNLPDYYEKNKKFCLTKLKGLKKTPTPSPGPSPTPGPEPKPSPGLKGPGCRPGSSFIGLNGITSGPLVTTLQQILTSGMLTGGKSLPQGVFDSKTEEAVMNFQKEYGVKYAGKIKSQLGRNMPLDKVDGCVGPKTACALLIHAGSSGVSIAGYDIKKCKQKFGASKIAQNKLAAAGKPEAPPEITGGKEIAIGESKNWLDRTREDTTSSLFERLVKDVSNKKVI